MKRVARAAGIASLLAVSGSGCTEDAAASVTMTTAAPIASVVRCDTAGMVPQPPFDTTPISPVEGVGAGRNEQPLCAADCL
jgi:hypothetical protein